MPMGSNGKMPLPAGWEEAKDVDGKKYFIDHNHLTTSWIDPRDRLTKPKTFSDCVGSELPFGWEEYCDKIIGIYYINHNTQHNQQKDPRQEWFEEQDQMLKEYLCKVKDDLVARHDMLGVKQRRLNLAQEEVEFLTSRLEKLNDHHYSSKASVGSVDSFENMEKYNPHQLKEDIANARKRVSSLRRELCDESGSFHSDGIRQVEQINCRFPEPDPRPLDQARTKVIEMKDVREQLLKDEQQKIKLLQELLRRQRDLNCRQLCSSRQCGSLTSLTSTGSGAVSPYTGSEENLAAVEQRCSKRQLRKDHQLALQRIVELQSALELIDYHIEANKSASGQHRYNLYVEKEALLTELDRFETYVSTEEERIQLEEEKEQLLRDLVSAREVSEKVIEGRMQLEKERQILKQQLSERTRQTNLLEMKLKSLSASTLSVSSSSSRGSISTGSRGSLSASSRGSLNSLPLQSSHADMVAASGDHPSANYHGTCPPIYEASVLATSFSRRLHSRPSSSAGSASPFLSNSRLSLASSSLSQKSLSPPVSPHTNSSGVAKPESYQTVGVRCRRTLGEATAGLNEMLLNDRLQPQADKDSGIFDAVKSSRTSVVRQDSGHSSGVYCEDEAMEAAQVRVSLKYAADDEKLVVSIQKARNIRSLCFDQVNDVSSVFVKGRLVPTVDEKSFTFQTVPSPNVEQPSFQEQFLLKIARAKLVNKTLQLDVYGMVANERRAACLGGVQISLADFDAEKGSGLKWYNLLSSTLMDSIYYNSSSMARSSSSLSSESARQRLVQRYQAFARPLVEVESREGLRARSDSWSEKESMLNGSIPEELHCQSLSGSQLSLTALTSQEDLSHVRSSSEVDVQDPSDVNIGRSVSDCTGQRRSFRIPFERAALGRRSVRMNRQLACPSAQLGVRGDGRHPALAALDLEMELQAAYAKQHRLNEEIQRLREIRQLMEETQKNGCAEPPDWLTRTGGDFLALLDEAEREVNKKLSTGGTALNHAPKSPHLRKADPKLASAVGFNETQNMNVHPERQAHWV